jgi:hypothetical protein
MQTAKASETATAIHGTDRPGTAWCGREVPVAVADDAAPDDVTCRRCLKTDAAGRAAPAPEPQTPRCERGHDQTLPGARYAKPSGGSMCAECRRVRAAARTAAKRAARTAPQPEARR